MTYEEFINQDARLVILRELAKQHDGTLNETLISKALELFAYKRSREWVRTQLRKLEELGVVRIRSVDRPEVDPLLIVSLTHAGVDHVERRSFVEGVARPSLGG